MYFPVADIELSPFVPPLIACTISFFTSMAGVSGAFLLLPFQVSVLGFSSPAVSSTNHLYNVVAIPSGIYRFYKEKRMLWPLTWLIVAGTLPGVFAGALIRIRYLPSPAVFKTFVGFVLLYIGCRLTYETFQTKRKNAHTPQREQPESFSIKNSTLSFNTLTFTFNNQGYLVSTFSIVGMSIVVGLIGGIYGIGGGAIIAPFLVSLYKLPIHAVAGASLMGTFVTSFTGVIFFQLLAFSPLTSTQIIAPDYRLGLLFGLGGAIGMYLGARAQRFFNAILIKSILSATLLFTACKYIFFG